MAAALAAAAIASCGEEPRDRVRHVPDSVGKHGLAGRVVAVSDGDTIRVRLASGRVERVRYIGIDTPETHECFAGRARELNERLVGGRVVRLVLDVGVRDRYGRLLAYVYAGEVFVNAELVRRGYAQPLTVPPNVRHATRFKRLAGDARRAGKGLWASCVP